MVGSFELGTMGSGSKAAESAGRARKEVRKERSNIADVI